MHRLHRICLHSGITYLCVKWCDCRIHRAGRGLFLSLLPSYILTVVPFRWCAPWPPHILVYSQWHTCAVPACTLRPCDSTVTSGLFSFYGVLSAFKARNTSIFHTVGKWGKRQCQDVKKRHKFFANLALHIRKGTIFDPSDLVIASIRYITAITVQPLLAALVIVSCVSVCVLYSTFSSNCLMSNFIAGHNLRFCWRTGLSPLSQDGQLLRQHV